MSLRLFHADGSLIESQTASRRFRVIMSWRDVFQATAEGTSIDPSR